MTFLLRCSPIPNPGDEAERGFMGVGKFLAIYRRVVAGVPVDEGAELRFEYGDESRPAVLYHVDGLQVDRDGSGLRVALRSPQVTCKARDRKARGRALAEATSACCGGPQANTACCG